MKRFSEDIFTKEIILTDSIASSYSIQDFSVGIYVGCIYDNNWYIGTIIDLSYENNDILVRFMSRKSFSFYWPTNVDECWIPLQDIYLIVNAPNIVTSGSYSFTKEDIKKILSMHK